MVMKKLLYIISNLRKIKAYFSKDNVFDNHLGFAIKILTFLVLFSVTYNLFGQTGSNYPTRFSRAENRTIKCDNSYKTYAPSFAPISTFLTATGNGALKGSGKIDFGIKAFSKSNCLKRIQ
jgi:hypothetical protein